MVHVERPRSDLDGCWRRLNVALGAKVNRGKCGSMHTKPTNECVRPFLDKRRVRADVLSLSAHEAFYESQLGDELFLGALLRAKDKHISGGKDLLRQKVFAQPAADLVRTAERVVAHEFSNSGEEKGEGEAAVPAVNRIDYFAVLRLLMRV
ncbi:hypothetical protein BU23DRAFT_553517 [Bimuria novae-zelandiae CBS 107.79]|uniref:Uncharacterized protein n=1 Tax=Bimuria novae-zelandiae CBS 107.79 TaxID=1447943 RepID=A0A6A5VAD6_9PLEO|nr:hypothetical protein BU23DRAFT_553517 [Bimuria novae-zelandiae CBS 107.79]